MSVGRTKRTWLIWQARQSASGRTARQIAAPLPSSSSLPIYWDQPTSTSDTYKNLLHFLIHSYPTQCNLTEHIVYIYYDMNLLSISAHNSHQFCVRVVPSEDGQVMPENFSARHQNNLMTKVLKLAVWNDNGLCQHAQEVRLFIQSLDLDILLVSEVKVKCASSWSCLLRN
jgi:hypothetical protein